MGITYIQRIVILFLTFCLCSLVSISLAQKSPSPTSVQNVHSICLGYFEGKPKLIGRYKYYLEKYLTLKGFTVTADKQACEATLAGSFKRSGIPGVAVTSKTRVVLIDQKFNKIWYYEAETPWFNYKYTFGKYLWKDHLKDVLGLSASAINRAWDVATALESWKVAQ